MGTPLLNSFTRTFLVPGGFSPAHKPIYNPSVIPNELEQGLGGITNLTTKSPYKFGKTIHLSRTREEPERVKISLSTRYAQEFRSEFMKYAKAGCPVDIQINAGSCTDPSVSNKFDKSIILKDALVETYGTSAIGAVTGGSVGSVVETIDLSAAAFYEINPMSFSVNYQLPLGNAAPPPIIGMLLKTDDPVCEECPEVCTSYYALPLRGYNQNEKPLVFFSHDSGATWDEQEIDTFSAENDNVSCFAIVGEYMAVFNLTKNRLEYTELANVVTGATPDWTSNSTLNGVTNIRAMKTIGKQVFAVGIGGRIGKFSTPDTIVPLDLGVATSEDLYAVDALSKYFAVAGGNNGALVYTRNGKTWQPTSATPTSNRIVSIVLLDVNTWLIGDSNCHLYYTTDGGLTWAERNYGSKLDGNVYLNNFGGLRLVKSKSGILYSLEISRISFVYFGFPITFPYFRVWQSVDAGYSWIELEIPLATITPIGYSGNASAIAVCPDDHNVVLLSIRNVSPYSILKGIS